MFFSILIPIYNAEKFLEECIQSCLDQSFKDYEIIAINDGSTDNTQNILEKYKNNITILTQENKGVSVARNKALELVKGEFIIFLDSDDVLKPDALEFYSQIINLHEKQIDIIYNNHILLDIDSKELNNNTFKIFNLDKFECHTYENTKKLKLYKISEAIKFVSQKLLTTTIISVFKIEFIRKNKLFFVEDILYEDIVFGMQYFAYNPIIAFANYPVYKYRLNPDSIMNVSINNKSIENIQLNLLKWINVSREIEKIYLSNKKCKSIEKYYLSALKFCIYSAITELQKYGYQGDELIKKEIREKMKYFSKYVDLRKKLLILNPILFGLPKRITRKIQGKI